MSEPKPPAHDERKAFIAELRWLADARKKYETDLFPSIAQEVKMVNHLADILERKTPVSEGGEGFGWIPSWLWDEWDQMVPRTAEGEQTPEPLPLDPKPWLCTNPYCWYLSEHRESKPGQGFAFEPREWYEQDRARYRKDRLAKEIGQ